MYDELKKDKMISMRVNRDMYSFLGSIPKMKKNRFIELSIKQSRRWKNWCVDNV